MNATFVNTSRRLRSRLARSILRVSLVLSLFAGPAVKPACAAEPADACPSHEAVGSAVRALLRPSRVDTAKIETQFEVQDFGDHYAVTVKGRRRDYHDEPRDCAKRAHVAAVFIALTLSPPDIPLPEQPDADPSAPPASEAPSRPPSAAAPTLAPLPRSPAAPSVPVATFSPPPASRWSVEVELGALVMAAPRGEASEAALGAELRWSILRALWGLSVGAHVATASTLELDSVPVHESRIPLDLSVRRTLRTLRFQGSLELGLAAALTRVRQRDLANAETETLLELGARAAGRLALNAPLGPYLSVFTEVFPFPQQLAAEPRGSIGHTSTLWLGTSLGLAAKFP